MRDMAFYVKRVADSWPQQLCATPLLQRLLWLPALVLMIVAAVVAYWAVDRPEPIRIVAQPVVPKVRAGELVHIQAIVRRAYAPGCEVRWRRYLVTPAGFRVFEDETHRASTDTLIATSSAHPDELRTTIEIPVWITPGTTKVVADLEYWCNPVQRAWPTRATTVLLVEVVAPS